MAKKFYFTKDKQFKEMDSILEFADKSLQAKQCIINNADTPKVVQVVYKDDHVRKTAKLAGTTAAAGTGVVFTVLNVANTVVGGAAGAAVIGEAIGLGTATTIAGSTIGVSVLVGAEGGSGGGPVGVIVGTVAGLIVGVTIAIFATKGKMQKLQAKREVLYQEIIQKQNELLKFITQILNEQESNEKQREDKVCELTTIAAILRQYAEFLRHDINEATT